MTVAGYAQGYDRQGAKNQTLIDEAKTLASALNQWLQKHDQPGAKSEVRAQASTNSCASASGSATGRSTWAW